MVSACAEKAKMASPKKAANPPTSVAATAWTVELPSLAILLLESEGSGSVVYENLSPVSVGGELEDPKTRYIMTEKRNRKFPIVDVKAYISTI